MVQAQIDGKIVHFTPQAKFRVEVGHGPKGSYKPRYSFTGNAAQACFYYRGINVGRGYKKRLVLQDVGQNPMVLAREFS